MASTGCCGSGSGGGAPGVGAGITQFHRPTLPFSSEAGPGEPRNRAVGATVVPRSLSTRTPRDRVGARPANLWRRVEQKLASGMYRTIARVMHVRKLRRENRGFREMFGRNNLLRVTSREYRDDIQRFWRTHYGKDVKMLWHVACANVTGHEDVRYIPNDVWYEELLPFFNKAAMRAAYIDKNIAGLLLGNVNAPDTIVRRIHGEYYDNNGERISRDDARAAIHAGHREQIIKPSLTDNGVGITKLKVIAGVVTRDDEPASLEMLEQSHGADFIVQSKIHQHPTMAAPHPDSVNTVRVVTFRWNGDIIVLLSFSRFGIGGNLTDNAATGGICCGIDEGGRLNPTAVDLNGTVYSRHPTTGYAFGTRAVVPNHDALCQQARTMHRRLHHFDIVSWDFAVGERGDPVFLEFNVRGTSYIYQFACGKPIFGELTQAVLERVRDSGGERFKRMRS